MRTRDEHLEERMKDQDFRIKYYYWEPDFLLADILLRFKIDSGLTTKELAKLLGIPKRKLSRFENTSGNPTLAELKTIAEFFGAIVSISFRKKSDI